MQALFMFFQIFAYALRPMFIKPDLVPLDFWVLCNLVAPRRLENSTSWLR